MILNNDNLWQCKKELRIREEKIEPISKAILAKIESLDNLMEEQGQRFHPDGCLPVLWQTGIPQCVYKRVI